jgi:pyruvate formate lyase activating enzyme
MSAEHFELTVPTKYWHELEDGRIQCDTCPRYCKLHEGQRGLCYMRARQGNEVVLTSYGRSSGFCVDPIEKKPLNHFYPGTSVLSFGTAGCNLSCKFCFHPDTLIATADGQRRIADLFDECDETLTVEDGQVGFPARVEVWTRQARLAPLAKVFAHQYSGDLLSLKASCCPPVLLTPNHRVFAAHRSNREDVRLVAAEELTTDHYLVIPKRRAAEAGGRIAVEDLLNGEHGEHAARPRRVPDRELVAALSTDATSAELSRALGYHPAYVRKLRGEFARGVLTTKEPRPVRVRLEAGHARFFGERGPGLAEFLDLTPDFAWLLGFYCAEGHVTKYRQRPNSYHLGFSCGHHERHLVERTARLLTELFDARPRVTTRRTTVTVDCGSNSIARLFEALCGSGAKGKRVPAQVTQASEPVIRAFLNGYFAGDGYVSETHLVGGTVSRTLALGLYELGLHLDLLPTFFVHEPPPTKQIEGRRVSQSTTFIVKFGRDRFEGRSEAGAGRASWRDVGDSFLVPVRRVDRVAYVGPVYNLEVDDPDHSYLAPFLAVSNCQNWDISKSRETDTLADQATPELIARAASSLGCRSVAFTYNDPTIFLEYAIDVAHACHEVGVKAVAVTAGYICDEPREDFYRHMDAANVDLKGFTERFYNKVCAGHLQPVLDTLVYLKKHTSVWFELTTLLIPDENDSEAELEEMTQWVVANLGPDVPLHFTAFHPDYKMTDKAHTPAATLTRARRIAVKNGVRYAYTGNVHDERGGSTYCHTCGEVLIGRDWYVLSTWNLTDAGACMACGTPCAGMFDGKPGTWGARRLPVRLRQFA